VAIKKTQIELFRSNIDRSTVKLFLEQQF